MSKRKKKQAGSPKRKSGILQPIQWVRSWLQTKHPILRFLLGFVGSMALFYLFYYSSFYRNYLEGPFLNAQATISNLLLHLLGHDTAVYGASIASADFSVDIKNGCDGLEAIAILASGILIFPVPFRLKLPGLGWGVLTLLLLNILRIAGLYLVGIHLSASAFEVLHVQGGFVIFTMISVILWFVWMNWAIKDRQPKTTEE